MYTFSHELPPLPEIGHPESYYARQVHRAEKDGNPHAREAYKVGQYITLALDPRLEWEKKLRYFHHALRAHCTPPPVSREEVWLFYAGLADLVRQHCGNEALRLASREDDRWARQSQLGLSRDEIRAEAIGFFRRIVGDHEQRPDYLNSEDWEQLQILKAQWV